MYGTSQLDGLGHAAPAFVENARMLESPPT